MQYEHLGQDLLVAPLRRETKLSSVLKTTWDWDLPITLYYHPQRARREYIDLGLRMARLRFGARVHLCPFDGYLEHMLISAAIPSLQVPELAGKARFIVHLFAELVLFVSYPQIKDHLAKAWRSWIELEHPSGSLEWRLRTEVGNWFFQGQSRIQKELDRIHFSDQAWTWQENLQIFAQVMNRYVQESTKGNKKTLKTLGIETRGASSKDKQDKIRQDSEQERLLRKQRLQLIHRTNRPKHGKKETPRTADTFPLGTTPWAPGLPADWFRPVLMPFAPYLFPSSPQMHIPILRPQGPQVDTVLVLDTSKSMLERDQEEFYYAMLQAFLDLISQNLFASYAVVNFANTALSSGWLPGSQRSKLQAYVLAEPDPQSSNFPLPDLQKLWDSRDKSTVFVICSDGQWSSLKDVPSFLDRVVSSGQGKVGLLLPPQEPGHSLEEHVHGLVTCTSSSECLSQNLNQLCSHLSKGLTHAH